MIIKALKTTSKCFLKVFILKEITKKLMKHVMTCLPDLKSYIVTSLYLYIFTTI